MNNDHLLLFGLYVTHLTLCSNKIKNFPAAEKPEFMNFKKLMAFNLIS